jgi:hypothetical protein
MAVVSSNPFKISIGYLSHLESLSHQYTRSLGASRIDAEWDDGEDMPLPIFYTLTTAHILMGIFISRLQRRAKLSFPPRLSCYDYAASPNPSLPGRAMAEALQLYFHFGTSHKQHRRARHTGVFFFRILSLITIDLHLVSCNSASTSVILKQDGSKSCPDSLGLSTDPFPGLFSLAAEPASPMSQ